MSSQVCSSSDVHTLERRARSLAADVVRLARARGITVSTAESCTAGMVASELASIPGASDVLRGGAVTYVNEIKERLLGVSPVTIERYTEVSFECAHEMASGARRVFSADIAVSLTGYAGPGGGTADNPVGTVYIGLASPDAVISERFVFDGDREAVRLGAACQALAMLAEACC